MKVRVLNKVSKAGTTRDGRPYTRWTFEDGTGRNITTFTDLSQVAEGGEIEGDIVSKEYNGKTQLNFYPPKKAGGSPMFEVLKRMEDKIDKLQESVNALGIKATSSVDEIEQANDALSNAVNADKEEINVDDIPF